jgi:endonuclease/exonuclease/phosphatase family metal-dependent hydrolase
MLELQHKPSSTTIVFIGTHLKAKQPFANIRLMQIQATLKYLNKHYSSRAHVIIAGDFNGDAHEPFYDLIRQTGFSSAYRSMSNDDKEPPFTTWKFREHDGVENEQCRTIDYIFYKPEGFVPVAVLKLPSKEDIGMNGLPSYEYPSDHLALETIFKINP